ncbi:hypothetical protein SCE1572_33500 [Sorangium cellulosum So0157-2]|uniref:Uncharacterized protein n=1 Tax=Sorangium cellulosum So0157-2 TaxID=1254432 RepID=S4Y467_SORCE|nr:hypothetical protein SCE1572_33500 [Sorangium cellulosum So0157-2]
MVELLHLIEDVASLTMPALIGRLTCGGGASVRACVSFCDRSYTAECARACWGR